MKTQTEIVDEILEGCGREYKTIEGYKICSGGKLFCVVCKKIKQTAIAILEAQIEDLNKLKSQLEEKE